MEHTDAEHDDHRPGTVGRIPQMPALDGLRAVALVVVLCFHGGFDWVHGGYLPLSSFFVLSGFLITALLLAERRRTGRIGLLAFWGRRVRRLAPGALLGMALVGAYLRWGARYEQRGVEGDLLASLGWIVNWRFITSGRNYADAFGDPSPLQHYWSLAVEEQFYLVLPLLALGLLAVGRGRRWPFVAVTAGLAAASVLWMRALHHPGDPPLRVYFGTDTRAAELLVGVLLACVLVDGRGRLRRFEGAGRGALDAAGVLALGASLVLWFTTREFDDRLYEGGLLGIALLAAVVVAAATDGRTVVGRVLGLRPLAWYGRLSYGVYLFHWPLFLWITGERTGLAPVPLFAVQLGITTALAYGSLRWIESPIRAGRLPTRLGLVSWANASVGIAGLVVAVAAALPSTGIDLVAGAGSDAPPPPPPAALSPAPTSSAVVPGSTLVADPTPTSVDAGVAIEDAEAASAPPVGFDDTAEAAPPPPELPPATPDDPAPATRVMVVGDSLGRNLAEALVRWADAGGPLVVYDATQNGCQISRGGSVHLANGWVSAVAPACGWWATPLAQERLGQFVPDVVLVVTGNNEVYDRSHPSWEGTKIPGDDTFDQFIVSEYAAAVDALGATGASVLWSVPPCVDYERLEGFVEPDEGDRRITWFDDVLVPALASARPGAQIADLESVLCPSGFSDRVLGVDDARPDGFHLTAAAADAVIAQWLGPMILAA